MKIPAIVTIALTLLLAFAVFPSNAMAQDDSDGDGILDINELPEDTDSDGTPNYLDPDDDGDGILTLIEGIGDQDSDGTPNYLDTDSDGDGVLDAVEAGYDSDSDGTPDYLDDDDDGDGIPTLVEGTDDMDFDGSPNYVDTDSDGDGILDAVEGTGDQDSDGIPNFLDTDSDGDGVADILEAGYDTDSDGTPDYLDDDDDGDGIPTLIEGTDDVDGDGNPNYVDLDSDSDGYLDAEEAAAGSDPYDPLSTPLISVDPGIVAISDVGNDQGRRVRIGWDQSDLDVVDSPLPIHSYSVYRRVDANKSGQPGIVTHANVAGTWDFVLNMPATGEDTYSTLAGTLCDSTDSGVCWSVFFVRAHTATPTTFYDSDPDSGYSVDNLAPSVPVGLAVAYGADNALSWEPSPDEDFRYFRIYRGPTPGFTPDEAHLVQTVTATQWVDPSAGYDVHYVVSAVDFAGNESPVAVPMQTSAADDSLPRIAGLAQNSPNPFNPRTTISFALVRSESVTLEIHDLAGRLVKTLLDGELLDRGNHRVTWEGRDARGRAVGAGVYFYSVRTGTFKDTKRMMLLK